MPNKEPWWHNYRKHRYTRRRNLTIEMILRKSIKETVKEYAKHCSIAGVKEMCASRINVKNRILRTLLFLSMIGCNYYFLQNLWYGTLNKPLIVTLESSTYPIDQIDFPAIALCNINRISKKALANFTKHFYETLPNKNISFEEVEYFTMQAGRLIDHTYDDNLRNSPVLDLLFKMNYNTRRIIDEMKYLAPSCDDMLIRCAWSGEIVDCKSIFEVRRTVKGHCCAFNYVLEYDSATKVNRSTIAEVKRQIEPGLIYGLNVILDPQLDDYLYPLSNIQGFDVLVFDPTHFADPSGGRVTNRIAEPNQAMSLEIRSVKQTATEEVRKYSLAIRECLFHDEKKNEFGNMYSYSACIVQCRIKALQSLCKCSPYFLPTSPSDGPICTYDNLRCLNKYREKILYLYPFDAKSTEGLEKELQDSLYCPECLPDCELTQHFTKCSKTHIAVADPFASKNYKHIFSTRVNNTNKCYLSVFQSTPDGILNRLDVVSYWFEILSNVGGFAGMLMGLSTISIIEIVYFLTIRLAQIFYSNYKKYH